VDEPQGIYRGEVIAIMTALADASARTNEILVILREDEDEDDDGTLES
jgi:hypothetical protein